VQPFEELLKIIEEKGMSLTKLSKESGISYDRLTSWKAGRGNPKVDDSVKIQNILQKYRGIYSTESPINKTDTQVESLIRQNEQLTLAHRELTQANKDLAHTNRDLAANLLELTKMINSNDLKEKISTASTIRSEVLELLAPIVKDSLGLEYPTNSKALSELDRRLGEIEKKKKVKGSHTS
jgi:transcriptional regulator with XRE-family HTH domain